MFVFFDTETTGLNRQSDRIVQIAWVVTNRHGDILSENNYIIKPDGYEIPNNATRIHGISTRTALESGKHIESVLPKFNNDMRYGSLIIAHNINFDLGILYEEYKRCNINLNVTALHQLCTMKLSVNWCCIPKFNGVRGFKWPTLSELHHKLFGHDFESAHDALADVHAARRCFFELLRRSVIVIPDILRPYSPENELRLHRPSADGGGQTRDTVSKGADLFSRSETGKKLQPKLQLEPLRTSPWASQPDPPKPEIERPGPFAKIKAMEAERSKAPTTQAASELASPAFEAEQGDAGALYELGRVYDTGRGVPKNLTKAVRLYRMAAAQGSADAQFSLGVMFLFGQGLPQDDSKAVRWLRMAAEQGLADAQYELWLMYDAGLGVPQNDIEAARCYQAAAEQGVASAQYDLAIAYQIGRGVPQDETEAMRWLQMAADQGHADAQHELGLVFLNSEEDDAEAARWLRLAAEQGHADAQYELWQMYEDPKDFTEAMRWLQMAAEQGHADAQYELGLLFLKGEDVPQDYTEAARWFRQAVEPGNADAQYGLGMALYNIGRSVPQVSAEALHWYRLAAEEGNDDAQYELGVMFSNGRGVSQDYNEAARWLRMAAEQGNADAQYELWQMYDTGRGVSQDKDEAVRWLRLAVGNGNANAQYELGKMYETGRGEHQSYFEAVRWYRRAAQRGHVTARKKLWAAGYSGD